MTQQLLKDLALAKATFQLRAIQHFMEEIHAYRRLNVRYVANCMITIKSPTIAKLEMDNEPS